jgi:hypothetical protein
LSSWPNFITFLENVTQETVQEAMFNNIHRKQFFPANWHPYALAT